MREYRDELAAAHQRIAQLEEHVARSSGRAPSRSRLRWFGWVALAVSCAVVLAGAWSLTRRASGTAAVPGLVPADARLRASWYPQPGVLPALVDVDGDGTKDYVGLFFRAGSDSATSLFVAAVDGKTFAMKWRAGPFSSEFLSPLTHIAVVRDRVVLSLGATKQNVTVLDLRTGNERASVWVPGGFLSMCPLDGETARAVVRWSTPLGEEQIGIFDADTSQLKPEPGAACHPRYDVCTAKDARKPCFVEGPIPGAPREAKPSKTFHVSRTWLDADLSISLGTEAALTDVRQPPQAVAFLTAASTPLWQVSLLEAGDDSHFGEVQAELRGGKLVSFYHAQSGPFRLLSRDARSARVAWSAELAGAPGSNAVAFGVEDDRVMVVLDSTLHIFDAGTGAHLARLGPDTL